METINKLSFHMDEKNAAKFLAFMNPMVLEENIKRKKLYKICMEQLSFDGDTGDFEISFFQVPEEKSNDLCCLMMLRNIEDEIQERSSVMLQQALAMLAVKGRNARVCFINLSKNNFVSYQYKDGGDKLI
ncbi:MAG: hypothetical protein PHP50_03125 [Lachnospiraceae bacterium]|nr:hypothetical protein [Lachnospiraceae bacterium]